MCQTPLKRQTQKKTNDTTDVRLSFSLFVSMSLKWSSTHTTCETPSETQTNKRTYKETRPFAVFVCLFIRCVGQGRTFYGWKEALRFTEI